MNILFVLYGDLNTNTAGPIQFFANELQKIGHECVITVPSSIDSSRECICSNIKSYSYEDIFRLEGRVFGNGLSADVVHACTPRIAVLNFLKDFLVRQPIPLVIYLEDNETWISEKYLGFNKSDILKHSVNELTDLLPYNLSNPLEYPYALSLANLVILIQEKLVSEVPFFKPSRVIPWGVNQSIFSPDVIASSKWIEILEYDKKFKYIVYHGGLNGFTYSPMLDLCRAIEIINSSGTPCKLIRTGINPINFWDKLNPVYKEFILEIGVVDRNELPSILALADLYVQPGRIDPFEDLRLPSKLPEFLSMGRPVVMPNIGIANLLQDGLNVVLFQHGDPEDIAKVCLSIFRDEEHQRMLGIHAREFAQQHFNLEIQARKLEGAYKEAVSLFEPEVTKKLWQCFSSKGALEAGLLSASYALKEGEASPLDVSNQLIAWCRESNSRISSMESQANRFIRNSELSEITKLSIPFWRKLFRS